jgi:cytochrome b561
MAQENRPAEFEHYSGLARFFHWLSVLIVFIMVGTGMLMVYRGKDLNIWDQLTNNLYMTHKTLGLALLVLIALRLLYRVFHGAPDDEPSLNFFHRFMSHSTHWALYGLLIALPLVGWYGVSLFPALNIFGGLKIPALVAPDQGLSKLVFWFHAVMAYALMALVAMHIGAGLYHHILRGDNVLRRMLPSLKQKN